MKNIFAFIFFLVNLYSYSQIIEANTKEEFPLSLVSRYFENLNQYSEIYEKYPQLKEKAYYTILGCINLLHMKEEEIQLVGKARLKGIATQLYREKKPVMLITGLESALTANSKNENVEDDNNLIYISIGDCVITESEQTAKETFNNQTMNLISKK